MKRGRDNLFRLKLLQFILVTLIFSLLTSSSIQTSAQSGGALSYGSRVYGTISSTTPLVSYRFSGQQGDLVAITAVSWTGTLDIRIEMVAPDGTVVNRNTQDTAQSESLDANLSALLPQQGVYVLRLSGDGGTEGDFVLIVSGRAAVSAAPLVYGQAVDVTVVPGSPSQYFSFEAQHCPTTLVVSDTGGQPLVFPAAVKVRDQRGQAVALVRVGETFEDRVTVEAYSGRYEVEVGPADHAVNGALRLLVTCSGDAPGCQPASGTPIGGECPSCPSLDDWIDGGSGCPDLGLLAESDDSDPASVTVTWTPMAGADGYAVYVSGIPLGGGEVYLTHAEWVPGNPTRLTWVLPEMGYSGFIFKLQVLVDGIVICTDEAEITVTGQQFVCPELDLAVTMIDPAAGLMRATWSAVELADGYQFIVFATDAGGVETEQLTSEAIPPDVTTVEFPLPDGYVSFRFVLRLVGYPLPCEAEIIMQPGGGPCAVRTNRTDVAVRVGPGLLRGHFMYMPPGIEYTVIGQAADETGALWWQLDKTQFAGHEGVISLWVAQADVEEVGVCTQIPQVEIPPIIPEPEEPPETGWGPCGSCDTCGHPASECVTSPEGLCLWDPATCRSEEPGPGDDDDDEPVCYTVSVSIDMGNCFGGGSVSLDTAPNCPGGYTPGTSVQAHATAEDQKCQVQSWSGCHASGSGSSVTFVPRHSCTLVAHMGY